MLALLVSTGALDVSDKLVLNHRIIPTYLSSCKI